MKNKSFSLAFGSQIEKKKNSSETCQKLSPISHERSHQQQNGKSASQHKHRYFKRRREKETGP